MIINPFKSKQASVDPELVRNVITRGVEDVFVKESLEKKLLSGKPLRIKLGFDPTGSNIHIGRAVILRKLRAFQDLGHKIVFIVGDFTAQIGDPSDKLDKRPMISKETINKNLKNYKKQVGKIINLRKAEFHYNSAWLAKLRFQEITELAESFSVQQMLARRNFKERSERGEEISLREFMYPLMQGYDSVMVNSDVEIGGFDQLFNLKAGRAVQRHYGMAEQDVLTVQMLEGTDGRKMSTSWGNVINITDEPNDMFGKIMSIRDNLISKYFLLCTDMPEAEINAIEKSFEMGSNPRDAKMKLATEIVTIYHGKEKAEKAKQAFVDTFQKGVVPEDVMEIGLAPNTVFADALLSNGIIKSKSEFRRLVEEGAVQDMNDNTKVVDPNFKVWKDATFKVGKRRFVKIKIQA
ncbi:MAG: tyrosine--tRNA ligase [Candidatus Paceibacterota bacterium]